MKKYKENYMLLPVDFTERMKKMLPNDEYKEFLAAMERPPENGIRINTKKKNAGKAMAYITDKLRKTEWCSVGYYADKSVINGKHPYHHAGLFYFQEPSAMAVGEALKINPSDKILDLCAAPGGKSTHIGAKLGKDGLLVSNEVIRKRAGILAENIERLGIGAVVLSEFPERLEKRFGGFFDKIIVDAPCSGEGMFRKEPQAVTDWSIAHTEACAVRQAAILRSAVKMLASDGYIIYSTCTFAPCENEGVIDAFLNENPDFELCETELDMLSGGKGGYIGSDRDFSAAKRIFPHKNDGEGHFVAVLHYKGNAKEHGYTPPKENKNCINSQKLYREFEKKFLNCVLDGEFELFGENLYIRDRRIGSLDKLKAVRAGLNLGRCIISERGQGRFEPSYALALYLDKSDIKNTVDFPYDSKEINDYLKGNIIESKVGNGWCGVCVDGFVLGWGKAADGIIKNKYPKYLRE